MIGRFSRNTSSQSKKRYNFLIILLAVVCGLLAAGLVYMAGQKATPSVPVLAAKTEIAAGDPLEKSMFKEVLMPPAGLPEGTLKPNTPLENAVAKHALSAGDILRKTHIIRYDSTDIPLLSARLKALQKNELRAVEVPAVESVEGMLGGMKAGDRVDIISVTPIEEGSKKEIISQKIIGSAPVIGVRPPGDGPGVLIVALTETQVNKFFLAGEMGKVYASLCPFGYEEKSTENKIKALSSTDITAGGE